MREMVVDKINTAIKAAGGKPVDLATVRAVINNKRKELIEELKSKEDLTDDEAYKVVSKKHVMLFIILDD